MTQQSKEGIILPSNLGADATAKAAAGEQLPPGALAQAEKNQEAAALTEKIEAIINTTVVPYKDDAPLCDAMTNTEAVAEQTRHHGAVSVPAWSHGRCIGSACNRFKTVNGHPICGRALQDLAAAKNFGITNAEIDAEFARWAYPADAADATEGADDAGKEA